jgi:preprotein translocase subunit SecG
MNDKDQSMAKTTIILACLFILCLLAVLLCGMKYSLYATG